jgi:hypothetical protein
MNHQPYSAKKQHDDTGNKAAVKRGTDFLAFIQTLYNQMENDCGANWFNHHELNDKDSDKIFDHMLHLLINCVGLSAG